MALTLPNPSIVFVPLDILTADELNQMVQNTAFLAQQFPLSSENIANNAISAAKIATGAIEAAKIATGAIEAAKIATGTGTTSIAPTGKNVIRLGARKLQWGKFTVANIATDTDKTQQVTFPESFSEKPKVLLTVSGWIGIVYAQTNDAELTTSKFTAVIRHSLGRTSSINVDYLAIG